MHKLFTRCPVQYQSRPREGKEPEIQCARSMIRVHCGEKTGSQIGVHNHAAGYAREECTSAGMNGRTMTEADTTYCSM
jgi:hypothetical protein